MILQTLTLREVSESLKVSEDTVMRIIKSGQLSAAKINKQWRIASTDLETYFKNKSIQARKKIA